VAPLYTHDPLLAAENDDFYAILYGDVSGNWSSSGTELAASAGPSETEAARVDRRRALALSHDSESSLRGDVNAFELSPRTSFRARVLQEESADGRSRRVIVSVKEGEAIQALDVKLSYGPQGVEVLGFETTSLTQEFDVVVHDSESVFRAAAWSVLPLGGSGDVFVLTLRHRSAAVETGPLRLEILANEQVFVVVIPGPGRTVREGPSHPRTPRIRQ
jgi:hypothetical protein